MIFICGACKKCFCRLFFKQPSSGIAAHVTLTSALNQSLGVELGGNGNLTCCNLVLFVTSDFAVSCLCFLVFFLKNRPMLCNFKELKYSEVEFYKFAGCFGRVRY